MSPFNCPALTSRKPEPSQAVWLAEIPAAAEGMRRAAVSLTKSHPDNRKGLIQRLLALPEAKERRKSHKKRS